MKRQYQSLQDPQKENESDRAKLAKPINPNWFTKNSIILPDHSKFSQVRCEISQREKSHIFDWL